MIFSLPARAAVFSTVAEVATAIALAAAGYGVLALALGTLASQLVLGFVLLAFGRVVERPWPRFTLRGVAALGAFGSRLTTINVLPSVVDIVLVPTLGFFAGPVATGLFNRSQVISNLLDRTVLEGIDPVILPAVSGALRSGVPPGVVLATKLDYLTVICWPAFAMIVLFADPIVALLLGSQWGAAVPAVRILAIGGFALPLTKMSVKFFTAVDALDSYLRIQAAHQIIRLVLGIAGAMISLEAFCAGISAGLVIKALLILVSLHRRLGGPVDAHRRALRRGLAITTMSVAAPAVVLALADIGPVGLLAAAAVSGFVGWLAALWLLDHPLLRDARTMSRDLRMRKLSAG